VKDIFDLRGRVAVVTGAASGIGQATARLLADLGVHVVATDIDPSGLKATAEGSFDGTIKTMGHDVTSESDWRQVFATVEDLGRLDILVNNAGVMIAGHFQDAPLEHLRRQYRINVEGPFIGMQGAIPLMKASIVSHGARPAIINVSSVYGQVSGERYAAYSASKGAIKMLSKAVANELASSGIRVNSIHPGPTATKLGADHPPARDSTGEVISPAAAFANWVRLIPMGRFGEVGDMAPVIAFLASDAAGYITGAEIVVDGGYIAI
jgi:NAD(P)-dependent dehydrogenase (short-subunit alcohol dehydrogenase family)